MVPYTLLKQYFLVEVYVFSLKVWSSLSYWVFHKIFVLGKGIGFQLDINTLGDEWEMGL